jgi:hypothetical protein
MVYTYKNRFNKKFGFAPDEPHTIAEIAKITGFEKSGLDVIFNKGIGAFKTNPASVRPSVKSPEKWAQARVYSAVIGGPAARIDAKHLIPQKSSVIFF